MSEQWYIKGEGDEKIGPYTAEQMQRYALVGSLALEDLVWTERVDSWIPASSVEGLFPIAQRDTPTRSITSPSATPSAVLHPAYHTIPYHGPSPAAYSPRLPSWIPRRSVTALHLADRPETVT